MSDEKKLEEQVDEQTLNDEQLEGASGGSRSAVVDLMPDAKKAAEDSGIDLQFI